MARTAITFRLGLALIASSAVLTLNAPPPSAHAAVPEQCSAGESDRGETNWQVWEPSTKTMRTESRRLCQPEALVGCTHAATTWTERPDRTILRTCTIDGDPFWVRAQRLTPSSLTAYRVPDGLDNMFWAYRGLITARILDSRGRVVAALARPRADGNASTTDRDVLRFTVPRSARLVGGRRYRVCVDGTADAHHPAVQHCRSMTVAARSARPLLTMRSTGQVLFVRGRGALAGRRVAIRFTAARTRCSAGVVKGRRDLYCGSRRTIRTLHVRLSARGRTYRAPTLPRGYSKRGARVAVKSFRAGGISYSGFSAGR